MMAQVQLEAPRNAANGEEIHCVLGKTNRPLTLKFEDVVYEIKINNSCYFSRCCRVSNQTPKIEKKTILKRVSGAVLPGEMLAMLGPSGSGKTTLLTAIGGRLGGKLSGTITYNGRPFSNAIKRNTGFVTQDDVLFPHLTVTETLVYTALLRLPNSLTKEEKENHAKAVMAQLGLTKCRNNIIGGQFVRGVSGGERKRVSIGQEMLINPSLLFLDEPTSGLDSTTAQQLMSTLLELVRKGRTVVLTIHQPSSKIFYMFHKVLLLCDGHPVYFGRGSDAMGYFESVGHAPSVPMNPADFLLDLANGISSNDLEENDLEESQMALKQALILAYEHNIRNKLIGDLQWINNHSQEGIDEKNIAAWSTNWWQQFTVLLRRNVKENRHEIFSIFNIILVLFNSVIVGLLWWRSNVSHLQDQVGMLYFALTYWAFFALSTALFMFPQERAMLIKERSSGMYRLSSYFFARLAGTVPMELLLPTIFINITYWMGGLRRTADSYFKTLFFLLLNVIASQGLGLALGALIMDLKSASTLASVVMLTFMLTGGFIVQHVPAFIAWIKYISLFNYTYKLLLASQYSVGQMYPCGSSFCLVSEFPAIKLVGLDHVAFSGIMLVVLTISFWLIAYLGLMRVGVKR
ncbi:hypothetical protein MRB53_022476 [Persea americana]|uniref:Uncharacterized protein n=1 Tax=Persea americana TaxID=3435 RepID=A0ACC2L7A9_PERAE|nr:hypothetical protein MRB53_022476 [Persea americana]